MFLAQVRTGAIVVHPTHRLTVSKDEADNRFLECAQTAEAEYVVTGNIKHFPTLYKNIMVVTSRRFLEILD
jgi:predicted nucleic acid-binding protein